MQLGPTATTATIRLSLLPNPSHLEFVEPGRDGPHARAADRATRRPPRSRATAARPIAILIHGDAAFSGPGHRRRVAEPADAARLHDRRHAAPDREQPGRLHHRPARLRARRVTRPTWRRASTSRSSTSTPTTSRLPRRGAAGDGVPRPLRPRRADRPRRLPPLGPQRGRRAAYTQPQMYERVREHPTVGDALRARSWSRRASSTEEEVAEMRAHIARRLKRGSTAASASRRAQPAPRRRRAALRDARRAVTADALRAAQRRAADAARGLHAAPEAVRSSSSAGAMASATRRHRLGPRRGAGVRLAAASTATPIRLTGQDTERGTFSHRHAVLHDVETGETCTPMQHLPDAQAGFEVHNSPLTETACLGFEYGYSVTAPGRARAVGGAVRRLRQRRAGDHRPVHRRRPRRSGARRRGSRCSCRTASRATGRSTPRPGSSASSSSPPRTTCTIVNPTTPAQYFHLLRLQAHRDRCAAR